MQSRGQCRLHVRFNDSPSLSSNYQLILEEGFLPLPPPCHPHCLASQARPCSPSAWSPRSTHAECSHCISGLHCCHGNSVLAQVSGSSGCDLSLQGCAVCPHKAYTAPGLLQRREEGMWADLQVPVLSAYMPAISREPTSEGRLLPPIYEDVCS